MSARVLALAAVLVAGLCGGLIGYAVTDLQCDDGCTVAAGMIGVVAATAAAVGVAIIVVLTLRAMAEWNAPGSYRTDTDTHYSPSPKRRSVTDPQAEPNGGSTTNGTG